MRNERISSAWKCQVMQCELTVKHHKYVTYIFPLCKDYILQLEQGRFM